MKPLTERLREAIPWVQSSGVDDLLREAADEIKRLQERHADAEMRFQITMSLQDVTARRMEAAEAKVDELRAALEAALAHVRELEDAWQRGALNSRDGCGANGIRANRNVDVRVMLEAALNSKGNE